MASVACASNDRPRRSINNDRKWPFASTTCFRFRHELTPLSNGMRPPQRVLMVWSDPDPDSFTEKYEHSCSFLRDRTAWLLSHCPRHMVVDRSMADRAGPRVQLYLRNDLSANLSLPSECIFRKLVERRPESTTCCRST